MLAEQKKYFLNKGADAQKLKDDEYGEGIEDINLLGYGSVGLQSFTKFYDKYLNKIFENEAAKILAYRKMADSPEIGDVIEDAVNESTQENDEGSAITLNITADHLVKNKNITKTLHKEFEELFYDRVDIDDKIWDLYRSFLVDGRLYYERIAKDSNVKNGIINMKKLPAETMDMEYDPRTGRIIRFYQYLAKNTKRPMTLQEAQQREDVVIFNPEQIGFINYGSFGVTKYEMFGFLEKAKVPYNQLKLIETAIIIYRIVRAPERLVFKIDTGAMPRDKAMKFVEKIKSRFVKKQTYDPATGRMSQDPEVLCIRENTEIPLLDGRFLTLSEIIQEHNDGKENWVYTINQETLDVEPGKIKKALITRPDEQMVRVHYDNGCYVDTTPDHKFILLDGSECRAENLVSGTALMPLYTETKILGGNLDYQKIYNPGTKKWRWTHRMVNGVTKKDEVTHHVDYNRFNNNPTNLLTMNFDEHFKHHTDKLTTDWLERHDEKAESIRNGINLWRSNPDNVKRHSEWVIKTNIEQNKIARCLEVLNTPEMRERQKQGARKSKIEWFNTGDNREVFSKKKSVEYDEAMLKIVGDTLLKHRRPIRKDLCERLSENNLMMERFYQLNKDKPINNKQFDKITSQTLLRMIQHMGYTNYTDFRSNFGVTNHRVSSIEYLVERSDCGCIEVDGNHNFAISHGGKTLSFVRNSILDNFFIPTSSDGRGSDITTIGGNAEGFKNLDDLYHFQNALYRSLKYPLSRIEMSQDSRSSDTIFGGGHSAEITRDEIKWAKFLERQQNILTKELKKLFLLHLEFKGMKKQYGLQDTDFHIQMTAPSHYKESMEQGYLAQNFDNYNALSNNAEFSKYFLMKKYLHWDEAEIEDNVKGLEKDKELFAEALSGVIGDQGGFGGEEDQGLIGGEMTEEEPEQEEGVE